MKSHFLVYGFFVILVGGIGCGGGGGSDSDSSSGDVVTLSGTLSIESTASVNGHLIRQATKADEHIVQLYNTTEGTTTYVKTESDGTFQAEIESSDTYVIGFLNDDYRKEGGLIIDSDSTSATVGFQAPDSNTDLGEIILDANTGVAVPSGDPLANNLDPTYSCDATDGVPNGGILGEGTTGIDTEKANDKDKDGDCSLNLGDIDDDNDSVLDDQDEGDAIEECPGINEVVLFMNNKIGAGEVSADPTGSEIVITQHLFPAEGNTIQSVTVEGPSYFDNLVIHSSDFHDDPLTGGDPWDKSLVSCEEGANFCIFTEADANTDLGEVMMGGDTFVYNVTFDDETTATCTRMINSVLLYTPYNIRIGDDGSSVSSLTSVTGTGSSLSLATLDADGDGKLKLAYNVPEGTQLGFTHQIEVSPSDSNCSAGELSYLPMEDLDSSYTGDSRSTREEGQNDVTVIFSYTSGDWPSSSGGAWWIDVSFRDSVEDNAAATSVRIKTASSQCN